MRANKKDELISKALVVFYENGFHATGMDRLVVETGISKTSMYKHFKTKNDLIEAVLALRDANFRSWLVGEIEDRAPDPIGRLCVLFDVLGEWFETEEFKGCMFIRAASEFQDCNHTARKQSSKHKALVHDYVASLASEAGFSDSEMIARQIMLLKEGAIIAAYVMNSPTASSDAKTAAQNLLGVPAAA